MKDYISNFEALGIGLFVHFGLYSILGEGEWALKLGGIKPERYEALKKQL